MRRARLGQKDANSWTTQTAMATRRSGLAGRGSFAPERVPQMTDAAGEDNSRATPIKVELNAAEVLALYSFLALGEHFAATLSGEPSPFSPDEIRSHIANITQNASRTLMDKIALAVAAGCGCNRTG